MEKHVKVLCIHGHFYQPPRENPWLEVVEVEDGAAPYHDWNQRVAEECYAANTAARLLDERRCIRRLINTYAQISFNFGPTLISWIAANDPAAYAAIREADQQSVRARGHGNALAQVYNHIIMPLATREEKIVEIVWGLADFRRHFQRAPEGLWLAETAVDLETLELLAEHGIRFTILAPHQAAAVRPGAVNGGAEDGWQDMRGAKIDPSRPYRCRLPGGKDITLFFYDGPISRAVAFEGLLHDGNRFVSRLLGGFAPDRLTDQLVHIATDGESYGHHHRYGEMALAYALEHLETEPQLRLTNYAAYLDSHPPEWEVQIIEQTAWSCAHGVGRWQDDCGCQSGAHPGWNQRWRKPLREALDLVRQAVDEVFYGSGNSYFREPRAALLDYIEVILNRTPQARREFLGRRQVRELDPAEQVQAIKLLEMMRHRHLMYTSCAWFFDDISGLESLQVMKYAARAIQLASEFAASDLEQRFLDKLGEAKSNVPGIPDGRWLYRNRIQPQVVNLNRVAAHYAITSLFAPQDAEHEIYAFKVKPLDQQVEVYGAARMAVGRVSVEALITGEQATVAYALLHFGGHDFNCSIRDGENSQGYQNLKADLLERFAKHSLTDVVTAISRHFPAGYHDLQHLFVEERRQVLAHVTGDLLRELEQHYLNFYAEQRKLLDYLAEAGFPLPDAFRLAVGFALNRDLAALLERLSCVEEQTFAAACRQIAELAERARGLRLVLDHERLGRPLAKLLENCLETMIADPHRADYSRAAEIFKLLDLLQIQPNLWRLQNRAYHYFTRAAKDPDWRAPPGLEQLLPPLGLSLTLLARPAG